MNADGVIELTNCNINYFKLKQKAIMSTGACQVFKEGSSIKLKS